MFRGDFTPSQVELGGVEPPSKQVTSVLSTCLSGGWLSGWRRTPAPKATRSLLRVHSRVETSRGLYRHSCTSGSAADGRGGWEMSRHPAWQGDEAELTVLRLGSESVVVFANYCFASVVKASGASACMLTNPLSLLSKPSSPGLIG